MRTLSGHIIHKSIHPDGDIVIIEYNSTRYLYLGSDAVQSAMDLKAPNQLKLTYTQSMMAFLLFVQAPKHCLMLGLGGGALVKYLLSIYPHTFVDAVEIREDIISIAHTYFFVPHDKRLTIIPDDAYRFVYHNAKQSKEKYDVILVDVYDQNGLAPSVDKADFFSSCKLLLDQDGILVVNMWAASGHHIKQYLELLHLTFNSKPFCLPVPERGNVIVFVTNNAVTGQTFKHLKKQASQLEQQFTLPFSRYLQDIVKHNTKGWLSRFFNN